MQARALAAAVVLALGGPALGCSFQGDFDGTRYRCGEGDRCPEGTTCVEGFCVAGVDAPPSDAPDAPTDGTMPVARCGTLSLLQDGFDAVDPVTWWMWADPGLSTSVSGGHAVIDFPAGSGTPYAGFTSAFRFDLVGGALEARVTEIGGRNTILEVRNHLGHRAQVVTEAGMLNAGVFSAPNAGTRASIPYDPTTHRYWRLREVDGDLAWEWSVDRVTWNELHREPLPFDVAHVRGMLTGGGRLATDSRARFDDVNLAAPAGLAYCPGAQLVDGFDDAAIGPMWGPWTEAGCTVAVVGGRLDMAFADGTNDVWCGVATTHLFDLRDSEVVVDANDLPNTAGFVSYAQLVAPDDDTTHLEISAGDGDLHTEHTVAGTNHMASDRLYQPAMHRYWRLRGAGGRVTAAVSPDGQTWTTILDDVARFDLARVQIVLGAGRYATGGAAPVVTRWGGVNAP